MAERKRKFTESPGYEDDKSNVKFTCEGNVPLKMLIGLTSAGSLIGKGGMTISNIKQTAQIFMMVSKPAEVYPGTQDRICMLCGSLNNLKKAIQMIHETLAESTNVPDNKSIKFLITTETAGLIIGKKGVHIREMKEHCGCQIQISQKTNDNTSNERIIQFDGEWENITKAIEILIEKNATYPPSQSLSYSDQGDASRYASSGFQNYQNGNGFDGSYSTDRTMSTGYNNGSAYQAGDFNGGAHISGQNDPYSVLRGVLENRQMGRLEIQEILAAVGILKRHNVISLLSLVNDQQQMQQGVQMDTMTSPQRMQSSRISPGMNLRQSGNSELLQRLHNARDGNDFYVENTGEMPDAMKEYVLGKEFHISEHLVGLVIGPKGKNLHDMMNMTNTTINVSKRGVFAENTNNRIVTIEPKDQNCSDVEKAMAVKRAYYLVSDLYETLLERNNGRSRIETNMGQIQ